MQYMRVRARVCMIADQLINVWLLMRLDWEIRLLWFDFNEDYATGVTPPCCIAEMHANKRQKTNVPVKSKLD